MSRKRVKQYLQLLVAVGVLAVALSGGGTFASFNAEVQNNNNTFATGTLLLHQTSGSTTCASESASSNLNVTDPTGCAVLFNGLSIGTPASGTLHTAISSSPVTSIVADLGAGSTIEPGDLIKVAEGANNDTFTATAQVTPGSNVTIPVVSQATSNTYTTAATVTVLTYTTYADIALKNAGTLNAKDIKFDFPTGCTDSAQSTLTLGTTSITAGAATTLAANITTTGQTAITVTNGSSFPTAPFTVLLGDGEQLHVTATSGVNNVNWTVARGYNSTTAQTDTSGDSVTLQGQETVTLASGAAYGAPSGATLTVSDGGNSETVTTSQQVNPGDTTLHITSYTFTHTHSSVNVTYAPFNASSLCSSLVYSIVETDSSFHHDSTNNANLCAYGDVSAVNSSGIGCDFVANANVDGAGDSNTLGDPSSLASLAITDAVNSNAANELDSGDTRYFAIGVQTNVSSLANAQQNEQAAFEMLWHIDQK